MELDTLVGEPLGDDLAGTREVSDSLAVHREGRACEEGRYSGTEEDRSEEAVDEEERLVGAATEHITILILILVGDCLDDEAEEDEHPHPVGTTEAGRVEEGEGGEEATAEDDQRSEGEFPLTADRVHEELAVELLLANAEEERLAPLHEEQEDEESTEDGD